MRDKSDLSGCGVMVARVFWEDLVRVRISAARISMLLYPLLCYDIIDVVSTDYIYYEIHKYQTRSRLLS